MATQAQTYAIGILANRRNAQKSTSPRTLSMSLGAPEDLIMQNKPIFLKDKTNATFFAAKDYENKPRLRTPGKQTQSNPISNGAGNLNQ